MDRERVLHRCHDLLDDGGGVAIVGGLAPSYTVSGFWDSAAPWQDEVAALLRRWLGEERRAGGGTYSHPAERHGEVLARSRFVDIVRREYRVGHVWDPESVLGYLYSTSYAAKRFFGDRAPQFEDELRRTLLALHPQGRFPETIRFESLLARKRQPAEGRPP
jgi:hypothetical protein